MAIKLKSSDKTNKNNKLKCFLINKKTRSVVFLIACIIMAIIYMLTLSLFDLKEKYPYNVNGLYLHDYRDSYSFNMEKISFYEALCITSSFYLRNTDDNNKFILSDSTFREYVKTMQNYGLQIKTDPQGRVFAQSDTWDFFVAYSDKYLTNIDDLNITSQSELSEIPYQLIDNYDDYSLRANNTITTMSSYNPSYYYDNSLIYSDFFTKLGFSDEYPNESLPTGASGYDNLGRFIFQYFGDSDIKFYDKNRKDEKYNNISSYEILNEDDLTAITEHIEGYEATVYDDEPITLFFSIKPEKALSFSSELENIQEDYTSLILQLGLCWIVFSVFFIYLGIVCGYENGVNNKKWGPSFIFGKWYTEVLIAGLCIMIILSAMLFLDTTDAYDFIEYFISDNQNYAKSILCALFVLCFMICAGFAIGLISKFKSKTFISGSFIYHTIKSFIAFLKKHIVNTKLFKLFAKKTIAQKLYTITWIFIAMTVSMIFLFFLIVPISVFFYLLLLLIYLIYTIWFIITLFNGFNDINILCEQIKHLSNDEDITEQVNEYSIIYEDSKRLRSISENVKNNVEKQVQSERMKIELVTNVSHDLKTPLTSIISYIDLLKKEKLSPEAEDYVKILDIKSQKLKNIVSDVFSLAKATSGIDVNIEEIDGVILLRQVIGDNEDNILKSGKTLKTEITCENALINADGDKFYRVFQNLIDNALNYSMDGTRIFITMEKDKYNNMLLTVKNTASYEMNFTPEEITERFTRGDESRTDGGSGLGLSIAKSFTEACGGIFKIELDGDVFKAIVKMPLKTDNINMSQTQTEV